MNVATRRRSDLSTIAPDRSAARMPGTGSLRRSSGPVRNQAIVGKSRIGATLYRRERSVFLLHTNHFPVAGTLDHAQTLLHQQYEPPPNTAKSSLYLTPKRDIHAEPVQGMRAEIFASAQELLDSGRVVDGACLILDVRMPNMDGLELQRLLSETTQRISVIFFSARATKEEEDRALRSGAVAFLRKPVGKDALLRVIRRALESAN